MGEGNHEYVPKMPSFLELSLKRFKDGASHQVYVIVWRAEWLGVMGHGLVIPLPSHGLMYLSVNNRKWE